ncbi:hypothetical protein J53TS2_33460 [Paenibacillus sp. J53TS2]|nr:hypothetical protein J53TS2_33460 [Paenibacillus sp. J53TS2]
MFEISYIISAFGSPTANLYEISYITPYLSVNPAIIFEISYIIPMTERPNLIPPSSRILSPTPTLVEDANEDGWRAAVPTITG